MTELDKLEAYLKENGYFYARWDGIAQEPVAGCARHKTAPDGYEHLEHHQIVVFDEAARRVFDAICHYGSYGYKSGLLEVMGSTIVDPNVGDSVEGYLTADDIIKRLERSDNR